MQPSEHKKLEVDIAIIGGGMVGATLCALLKNSGWRIALIDAGAQAVWHDADDAGPFDLRVSALGMGAVNILTKANVWPLMQKHRACPYLGMRVWDAKGNGHIKFDASDVVTGAQRIEQLGYLVENRLLQSAAWQAIQDQAIQDQANQGQAIEDQAIQNNGNSENTINNSTNDFTNNSTHVNNNVITLANCRVESFAPSSVNGMAGWELSCSQNNQPILIAASLMVGADGAQSKVRAAAGINSEIRDYAQHGIVATITTKKPHNNIAYQRFLEGGPLALLPVSQQQTSTSTTANSNSANSNDNTNGHQCSIVWSTHSKHAQELLAQSPSEFCQTLTEASVFDTTGQPILGRVVNVSERAAFPLIAHHAHEYVQPNIALVGDAAHSIHPLAGQGVNLGLKDAKALADVLIEAKQKGKSAVEYSDLRRYARSRRADNQAMLTLTDSFQRASNASQNRGLRRLMNAGMNVADATKLLKRWLAGQAVN